MKFPEPQLGLVVSYSFLWSHEHERGLEEGRKDRPCVIIVAINRGQAGQTIVRVAPITHSPPDAAAVAEEVPTGVKRHLGLDDERSWVVLDEFNEFVWPGFDLRPVPGRGRIDYGHFPPKLVASLLEKARAVWRAGHGKPTQRD